MINYILIGATIFSAAFDLWFWIEFVKIAKGIWNYCYCAV